MTCGAELFTVTDPNILLRRLADFVRPYPAKRLADWFGCTEKTAEHFRQGTSWPNARHWVLIVRHFGNDILDSLYGPEINDTLARLRREERQLREKLHEIETRRIAAAGGVVVPLERRAPADDAALEPVRDLFADEARP